jgi:hypothetical protein
MSRISQGPEREEIQEKLLSNMKRDSNAVLRNFRLNG